MPVQRSKQLVWTLPVEASSGISFQNLTPVAFEDNNAPSHTLLFPEPPSSPLSSKKACHTKRKPANHIPRPPNAFILFRSAFIKSQHVSTEVETNHSTLSKIIGLTWQNLPEEERRVWHVKAKAALDDHKRKFPQYAFRPLHGRKAGGQEDTGIGQSTSKRRVREVGPKDLKRCQKIADFLVQGLKGEDLDAKIREFDKFHVPEVVTRFEDPMTERAYRKQDGKSKKEFSSKSTDKLSRKKRSTPARSASPPPLVLPPDAGFDFNDMAFTSSESELSMDFNAMFDTTSYYSSSQESSYSASESFSTESYCPSPVDSYPATPVDSYMPPSSPIDCYSPCDAMSPYPPPNFEAALFEDLTALYMSSNSGSACFNNNNSFPDIATVDMTLGFEQPMNYGDFSGLPEMGISYQTPLQC